MQIQSAAGFYGKLPCKGDFLQRHVGQEFVDAWDAWLQQSIATSREQLQERWLDAYLTSPVWRFVLSEGVCGSGAYAGVMLPSVDRVGRYFPLTLLVQLNTDACLLEIAGDAGRPWFDAAESLALEALQAHDLDLSDFEERVVGLGGLSSDESAATEATHLRELLQNSSFGRVPGQWQVPLAGVHSVQRAANMLASRELERTLRPLALWWTDGSDRIAPCWLCNRGLPAAASFAAMIAGAWGSFGWQSLGEGTPPAEPVAPVLQSDSTPIELSVTHTAMARKLSGAPRTYLVSRPDFGVWGIACSEDREPTGAAAAQAMADALHDISVPGTLSALAEEARHVLEAVRRAQGMAAVAVFLRRDDECAVVCVGHAQVLRIRSSSVTTFEPLELQPPATAGAGLLDLLGSGPEVGADSTVVHYDTLLEGDSWLLLGARLLDARQVATLPALLSEQSVAFAAIQQLCEGGSGFEAGELPLMWIAAAGRFQ